MAATLMLLGTMAIPCFVFPLAVGATLGIIYRDDDIEFHGFHPSPSGVSMISVS